MQFTPLPDAPNDDLVNRDTNPVFIGIPPFGPALGREEWIVACKERLTEVGPDAFLHELATQLYESMAWAMKHIDGEFAQTMMAARNDLLKRVVSGHARTTQRISPKERN